MLPDRVSNPGPLTYESGALPTALRGPAINEVGKRIAQNKTSKTSLATARGIAISHTSSHRLALH